MSTFGINCGHTKSGFGTGAVGIISESEHTRLVGYEVMRLIKEMGHRAVDCTIDYANSVNQSLSKIIDVANNVNLDWFVSIHFNAGGGRGTEVYTYKGRQYEDAMEVCSNISKLGFNNRGVKAGTGLYVIRKTKAKSMLIEVCFVDTEDANHYLEVGYKEIAKAIAQALIGYVNSTKPAPSVSSKRSDWDDSVRDKEGIITASVLNVRYTPGGKVIGSLTKGSKVKLWRLEGDWYHIYSPIKGYKQAYVHKNYVSLNNAASNNNKYGMVTASALNVRAGAGTNYRVIGQLQNGAKVRLDKKVGNWWSIYFGNHGGFVSADYIKLV